MRRPALKGAPTTMRTLAPGGGDGGVELISQVRRSERELQQPWWEWEGEVKRQADYEGQLRSVLQQRLLRLWFSLSLLPIPPTTHPSLPPPYQRPSFPFLRKIVSYFSVNSFCFPQNKTIQPSTSHGNLDFKERTAPVCDTWGKKPGERGQNRNSGIQPRSGVYFSHLASLI